MVVAASIAPIARYFRRVTTDAPPPTRRELRTGTTPAVSDPAVSDSADAPEPEPPATPGIVALGWIDDERLASASRPLEVAPRPDLLATTPRRSLLRPGVLIPTALLAFLVALYAATTLLWPLYAVAPEIEAVSVETVAAPAAAPAWPAEGSAALAVEGIDGALATTGDADSIASITKVVTALLVLDRAPLAVGESGPEYRFTAADRSAYWQYRARGESALDVPVGGALTQYQLLEGMLVGSANNYADRLVGNLWPSHAVYAEAANGWLETHGLDGITIVDPSGIDEDNAATPEALVALAERAMADPVIAEIVGRQSVELPGAGHVENTNDLLDDAGMLGIKTGTLDAYNLLTAKDITVGDTIVRTYASVLGQPDDDARDEATRALFAQLEAELQVRPSVTDGTVVGRVVTRWGEPVDIVTAGDASVVLYNGGFATAATDFALGENDEAGDVVGTLSVAGPLDSTTVDVQLTADVEDPDAWWRLTHPLELFGLG